MKYPTIIISILILLLSSQLASGFDVVFRLDDPSLSKSDFTDRVVDLFSQKQVPLSIAVVACDKDEMPIAPLDSSLIRKIQKGEFEICQHGMNHQRHDGRGEFAGIDGVEAKRRLEIARQILTSYAKDGINTFIPPHNAIGGESLNEIKKYCSILSSDMLTMAFTDGIDYYPETLGHMMDDNGVWDAASNVLRFGHRNKDICVIMFHRYDLESEEDWDALSSLLDYCKSQNSIALHTFSSLQKSGNHSSWRRLRANQLESGLKKILLKGGGTVSYRNLLSHSYS